MVFHMSNVLVFCYSSAKKPLINGIVCVLEGFGQSQLSDIQSVSTGMVSGSHTGSQGSEDNQLQHLLEERPCLLLHLTSLSPRKDVRNS